MPTHPTFSYAMTESAIRKGSQTFRHSYRIIPGSPVDVGHARQLLMDWRVVDDLNGARRTVHQPVKHPANPVIRIGEKSPLYHGTVIRDAHSGLFRAWVRGVDEEVIKKAGNDDVPGAHLGLYYESDNGVEWRAPSLGLFDHFGSKDNNVCFEHAMGSVIALPERMRHRGRYAMLYQPSLVKSALPDPENMHAMTQRIAYSQDGVRWTDAAENPVFYGRSDTLNNILYNPERDVFMHYRRSTVNAGEIRRIAYSESADLISWTQPINVVRWDEASAPALYGMPVSRYNGIYFGFLWNLWSHVEHEKFLGNGKDFKMDVELAWSRDGVSWERHPERPTFIPNSQPLKGAYDWGMVQAVQHITEVGDEVYIYYNGRPYLHKPGQAKSSSDMPPTLCLATLKRDRFVSVSTGDLGGYMLTKPLACPGGRLHINARTRPGGAIRVALREGDGVRDGEWPAGFRFEQSRAFAGDSLDHVMTWEGADSPASFPSTTIRLHFWREDADLYSFWFE
ncbi:MAG: hypothetical protein FJ319_04410 [SAR202 cluster bacterium]|nr:hypothetical protein [SAR202 cluster bacterium]